MSRKIEAAELRDETRLGRLLSAVENDPQEAQRVLAALPAAETPAHRIGITGSPGVGKSTLLSKLITHLRRQGHRVGVVAVDPTSPLTGGALLGDRLRLSEHQTDPGVFIRSLGSRGSLGGVTPGASAVAAVLDAASYDRVLIETVGVGQTGYDVISLADSVAVLFSPEGGDGVQLLKAGILEIGDVFAVNKSDRPGAEAMLKEIILNLDLSVPTREELAHHGLTELPEELRPRRAPDVWHPPVLRLVAKQDEGVAEIAAQLDAHRAWLAALPAGHPRLRQRLVREIAFVVRAELARLLDGHLAPRIAELAQDVQDGRIELWRAVAALRTEARKLL